MKRSLRLPIVLTVVLGLPLTQAARVPVAVADSAPVVSAKKSELVDLNSAAKAELVKLPGVGEAIADRIVAGRPWKSKYDLVLKKVVARSVYDKFSRLVIARQ